MKKIIYIVAIWFMLMNGYSCLDLNVPQDSIINRTSMWKTEDDCVAAVYGMYGQMRIAFNRNYAYWGDYRAGAFNSSLALGADISYMVTNTITSSNDGANWASLYKMINLSNLILQYAAEVEFRSEDTRKWTLANAYFARAFAYYYIARVWGDAPLVLHGFDSADDPGIYPDMNSAQEIYAQVENDLNEALELMPRDVPAGQPVKSTATITTLNMFKADFFMWMAKTQGMGEYAYNRVQEGLDIVFSDSQLKLASRYSDIFDATKKDANSETIFVIRFNKDEYEGGFASNYLFTDGTVHTSDKELIANGTLAIGTGGGVVQRVTYSNDFEYFLYEEPTDQRAQVNYRVVTTPAKTYRYINKYTGEWISEARYFTSDIIIYRLADAILYQAELYNAHGETDKAIDELNRIVQRAYGLDNFYGKGHTAEAVDNIILEERMKEFAGEGKMWWDLIRFGQVFNRVESLKERENEEGVLFWPIHDDAKNKNPKIK